MSVYRPVGYGPPPTVEEHLAGPLEDLEAGGFRLSWWLARDGGHPIFAVAYARGDRLYASGQCPLVDRGEWCRLDPATGLPCAIGTPPDGRWWHGLTVRTANALTMRLGLTSAEEVSRLTERDLIRTPTIGRVTIDEIKLFRKGFVSGLKARGASHDAVEYLVGHLHDDYTAAWAYELREAVALVPAVGASQDNMRRLAREG